MRTISTAFSRRATLMGLGTLALIPARSLHAAPPHTLDAIERSLGGGRLGVAAVELRTGRSLAHRANERFAMCSTFKWALAAQVLLEVQQGRATLRDRLRYGPRDLVAHSPITEPRARQGSVTLGEQCAAAIEVSDNTAANLLLRHVGGPAALTAFLRRTGDGVTRLDRTEPTLNENARGDVRDTTSPAAMLGSMRRLLFGPVLSDRHRAQLRGWMHAATTAPDRLRAGFPQGWSSGDKSGTGSNGAANDVAFARSPAGDRTILIACYIDAPRAEPAAIAAAHRRVAEGISAALA